MRVKVLIIHVKGNSEREHHIKKEVERNALSCEFVLEGNKEELNQEILKAYFTGEMLLPGARTSCAYKHFRAYEKLLLTDHSYALIIEDDMKLFGLFNKFFSKSLNEIADKKIKNFILSYEYSHTQSVRYSQRKKGEIIYKKEAGRFTGLYLIDRSGATSLLKYAQEQKCATPIDWFHNECISNKVVDVYWSYPALGQQSSHDGHMRSLIDDNKHSSLRANIYKLKRLYSYFIHNIT